MRINTNIMALDAYRNLNNTNDMLSSSLEKLSSGYRINRAADDASGLVISQNLAKQVSGLTQATQNAQDGISVVQTAEGALTQVNSMLQRMHDLIVQSANTASSDSTARQAAQNEISQLRDEIDRIGNTTSFGNQNLLDGSFGTQAARVSSGLVANNAGVHVQSLSFNIALDNRSSISFHVDITNGQYATTTSLQAEIAAQIKTALDNVTSSAAFTSGVTVAVRDTGVGAWSVEITRNSTNVGTSLYVHGVDSGGGTQLTDLSTGASVAVANTGGGVFQVGANVTAQNQIHVSIDDVRITSGSNLTFKALAAIDVTDTTQNTEAASTVDAAINAVSSLRGQLGAYQNRFQSTISNLAVTTENLSASESRIRDTDMASEMVNFTRDQILLQAGTAMLAQANAAPQTVLRLLQ